MAAFLYAATAFKCLVLVLFVSVVSTGHGRAVGGKNVPELAMAEKHEQWMAQHGRVYKDEAEKDHRLKIFATNVEFIGSFNAAGEHKYTLGINQFTDLTNEEFIEKYTSRLKPSPVAATNTSVGFRYANVDAFAPEVDWRSKGAVTPIQNQGACNSCWAFSAVAAIEGIIKIHTGKLIPLSVQELVDCDVSNNGCVGGDYERAFVFLSQQPQGLATESKYPYNAVKGSCRSDSRSRAAAIRGHERVPRNDETALLKVVAHQPVSAGISISELAKSYAGGIFMGPCGSAVNHDVTVVGYGTAADGTKYWLIKNWWGTKWGEDGYMRLGRGVSSQGLCGITIDAGYPIL